MDMTGTFMPAYGLNRIFGELPLVGALLGNGRDRGLIGVTYRARRATPDKPALQINPLSVIAPGIFRSDLRVPVKNIRNLKSERRDPQAGRTRTCFFLPS